MTVTPALVIALYLIGAGLVIVEMFVPGGVTGAAGVLLMGIAVYLAFTRFEYGWIYGSGMILLAAVAFPIGILKGLNRVALKSTLSKDDGYVASDTALEALKGREGEALTGLRPSGMALLDGKRVDVVAESGMIEKGAGVRVVTVEGNRVVVRQVSGPPPPPDSFA